MAKVNLWWNWPEVLSFILLVIGVFVGLGAGSKVIVYTLIILAGFMGGRVWFRIKSHLKIAWTIVLMGFLVGFMLGAQYGDKVTILILYLVGMMVSYYLHEKGILKSLEF